MCGIAGIYKPAIGAVREEDITRMRETLAHRGPDAAGNFISKDKKVAFGFRRLSIIDLSPAGNQPMTNADGTVHIVYNGEIYNFKSLRDELKKKYNFSSQSDTEVLIRAYEEWGTDCVERLNGIFAFVLWDEKKELLFFARDHIGVKPLYWAKQNGVFYFGSEIKAILAHPEFKKELNEEAVSYYLTFGYVPAPHTLFKDIKKLEAAHCMVAQKENVKEWEYWSPLTKNKEQRTKNLSEGDYVEKTRELLRDSINLQMVSDVPFGCFLSGGIDSSLNAALMSDSLGTPVETFSIGSKDAERYNEFKYSRIVSEKLGSKNHEALIDFNGFAEFLSSYGEHMDDPNADPTCFMVFALSKLVRDSGVTVIQTGEGGDELFAGYDTYRKAAKLYPIWNAIKNVPWSHIPLLFAPGGGEYARRMHLKQEPFWGHAIAFSTLQKEKLLAEKYKENSAWHKEYEVIASHYKKIEELAPNMDYINKIAYLDIKMRLADFLLMRVDKMAMAHSVEARVPFLDYRLVELALQIPKKIKLKNGELKHVLKSTARGAIPDEIIDRKKQGFGAPVEEWFRDGKKSSVLMDKIYNSRLAEREFFDYGHIRNLHSRHTSGENHTFRLMTLLTLSLWYDRWF